MEPIIDFDRVDDQGPQEYRGPVALTAADLDNEEVEQVGAVEMDVTVRKGDSGDPREYQAEGTVKYEADLRCARCLEPYPFANTSPFTVRFRPLAKGSGSEEEIEIGRDELEIEFYDERQIPLKQLAAEQIQLSLPMKPLCEEKCQGLCPRCGSNLNRGACSCAENVMDDRWDALKNIREQIAKKKDI